jgi:hypothetical protein
MTATTRTLPLRAHATAESTRHASHSDVAHPTRGRIWSGRILSGIAVAFLAVDTLGKLLTIEQAVAGTVELGYPAGILRTIGVIQALCLLAYLVPRTAVIGAVLFTGYLGGAIATHVRLENPLFTHVLFPIYVAALLWGGLYLRDRRVAALIARPSSLTD